MAYGTGYIRQAAPPPGDPPGTSTTTQSTTGETSTIEAGLTEEQQALVNTNRQYLTTVETIKGHNKRLSAIISFIEEKAGENPLFITNGTISDLVVPLDLDLVDDKEAYLEGTRGGRKYRTKDLNYPNLQKKMVELFFADPHHNYKYKKGVIQCNKEGKPMMLGFDTRRKFFDALKHGRKLATQSFNIELSMAIPDLIKGLRIANASMKENGQVEENEADAMPMPLFEYMCQSAVVAGNALWWVMSLLQWNLMARVQNIDNLSFASFSMGTDSIRVKYNQTKKDKTGQKTTSKNCYANPFNMYICLYTALAIYFSVMNTTWVGDEYVDFIFIRKGSKKGSASSNYCDYVRKWASRCKERITLFIRPDHTNAHGIRKGSATEATSSPETSLPSVFHRGEWSLGVVLDIYWKFAQKGDQLLGRILAGLDPDRSTFDVLPPHFTKTDDPKIKEAMNLCFGNIILMLGQDSFMYPILLRCLASLVHHESAVRRIINTVPQHPWKCLPIFCDEELLQYLKSVVTTKPTPGVLEKATGTARHTKIMKAVDEILDILKVDREERAELREERKILLDDVKKVVKDAIEEKAIENGHLTYESFAKIIDEREQKLVGSIESTMDAAVKRMEEAMKRTNNPGGTNIINTNGAGSATNNDVESTGQLQYQDYRHDNGKFHYVPQGYDLPQKTQMLPAFRLWINGDNMNERMINNGIATVKEPVRPFLLWTADQIPASLWKKFRTGWWKVLSTMTEAEGLNGLKMAILRGERSRISEQEIATFFAEGMKYLLAKYEFISQNKNFQQWKVTTWSKQINYAVVVTNGSDADKGRLGEETRWNKKHASKRTVKKRKRQDITLVTDAIVLQIVDNDQE